MRKRQFQRIKAGSRAVSFGQWSARKAQMLASAYKKAGADTVTSHDSRFLLFVYIGVGEDERLVSKDMYFRDLNECVWYAQEITQAGTEDNCLLLTQTGE